MDFELESKSVMIYINEETVNKLKEFPSIEEKDPVTGEWTTATVTVDEINNKKPEVNIEYEETSMKEEPEEEENNDGLEYTEEEIAYNKIDDVMFNKKCLNTEIEKVVKRDEEGADDEEDEEDTEDEEDAEICKINKNLNHDQGPFIYRDDGETLWNRPGYNIQENQDNETEMFYLDGKIMSVGYNKDDRNEFDKIIEECKTMCSNWLIDNNISANESKSNTNKIPHRSHLSNMMFSHIFMIMPCIWWIRIDRPHTDSDILYSKLMSMVMTSALIASYLCHYYNECILCNAETEYNKFAILCLNIYMYLRNVSIFYILPGGGILYGLHKSQDYSNSQNKDFYELYHPFCHYIAGLYIYYCVWNLENAQPKLCDTINNDVIFNDPYSGMNYHNI